MSHSQTVPNYRVLAQGRHFHTGVLSALLTVCIWSSWLLSMKIGVKSELALFDLAIMRYGVPGLVFAYFIYRDWSNIQRVPLRVLVGICGGAGLPLFYFASQGMMYAPVAHSGLLIAGTSPLFVTSIAVLIYKESLSKQRLVGLIAIGVGITVLLSASLLTLQSDVLIGDLYFLSASLCWAIYTICLRVSGLSPLTATGLLGVVTSLLLLIFFLFGGLESGLGGVLFNTDNSLSNMSHTSLNFLGFQFFVQAIMVGLLAGFSYGFAIQRIGAEATAAIGSLTPVLAALGAYFLLSENLLVTDFIAMSLVVFGVLLASEIMKRKE